MHDEMVEGEYNGRVTLTEDGVTFVVVDESDILPVWLDSYYMSGYGWVIRLSDYREWIGDL